MTLFFGTIEHPCARYCRVFTLLTLGAICVLATLSAFAQVPTGTVFNGETATPLPGGHDYIHLAAETVNPSSGSVSINFQLPMPKGRGITLPYTVRYNSAGLYHLGLTPSDSVAFLFNDLSGATYPWASWTMSSYTPPQVTCPPGCIPPPPWGPCNVASGFNFTDQNGTSHNLGLGVVANSQGYDSTHYCPTTGFSSIGHVVENDSDGKVWGTFASPTQTLGAVSNPTNGFVGPFTVTDEQGTTYFFGGGGLYDPNSQVYFEQPTQIEDRNGNLISGNVDTLGRQMYTDSSGGQTIGGLTYPSVACSSCSATTAVNYSANIGASSIPFQLQAGETLVCPPYNSQVGGSQPAETILALPTSTATNPQQFTLYYGTYNPNDSTLSNPYGLVNEIVYPDGGWVKYWWKMSTAFSTDTYTEMATMSGEGYMNGQPDGMIYGGDCLYRYSTPVLATREVSYNGSSLAQTQTFSYSTTWGNGQTTFDWTAKQTQVTTTDNITGASSLTVYNYTPLTVPSPDNLAWGAVAAQIPVESTIQYYAGSSTSTALLRTVTKSWASIFDLGEQDVTENGLTSRIVYSYNQDNNSASPFTLLTGKADYDYGASTATRTTAIQYQNFPSNTIAVQSNSVSVPVPSQPSSVIVSNSGGSVAETDYAYDSYGTGGLASVTAVQHDGTNYGTGMKNRGNVTSVTKKCFGCTSAVTTYTYDFTGQPASMTDPNGNLTTYSFTDSPAGGNSAGNSNAYLTSVVYPKTGSTAHQESFQYNYTFGDLTQSTDQNQQPTNYQYVDPFDRLTASLFPDGGETNVSYNDSPSSPSVTTCQLINGTASAACSATAPPTGWKTSVALMDGMFHTIKTELPSDPDGEDFVAISYDGLARKRTVSNPYRTQSSSTDGTAMTSYDVLGRPILVTEQDNSTVQTTYDQTCTSNTNTLGTLVTDEAGNQRRSCTDGLGRLVEVDEPGAGSIVPPTHATGSFTISGAEQSEETAFPTSGSLSGGITVSGSEKSKPATSGSGGGSLSQGTGGSCYAIVVDGVTEGYEPSNGTVSVTVNGVQTTEPWGGSCDGTVFTFDPPGGLSALTTMLAQSLTASAAGVTATSIGTSIQITANATGSQTNYPISTNYTICTVSGETCSGAVVASFSSALSGGANASQDTGTVKVIVDGYTASTTYGSGSTASSVASSLLSSLGSSGSPVTPSGTNPIGLTSKATGSASNYSGTTTSSSTDGYSPPSFSATPASFTFTGGTNAQYLYDTGTVSVTVGSFTATVNYGASDTPSSVATNLANYFNTTSGSPVTATVSGDTVNLTSVATGSVADYTYSATSATSQSGTFSSASFSATTGGSSLTGGENSGATWSLSTPYVTIYTYDSLNNLTCVEQHGGTTGTGCSSPTSDDPSSNWRVRRFTYDSLSRLLTAENPETGSTPGIISYAYDANGNVLTKTAPLPNQNLATKTVQTSYSYDALNRLTKKQYNDGVTPTVQFGYDAVALSGCTKAPPSLTDSYPLGRRTSMCDGSGATSWQHDKMGRVLGERRFIGNGAADSVGYAYNLDGSLYSVGGPDGRTVAYVSGGAGRPLSATDGSGISYVKSATYAPPGELASLINGGVINGALSYNSRLQPLQIFYGTSPAPSITGSTCPTTVGNVMHRLYNFDFGSGDNGNVASLTNCRDTTRTQSFTYDGLNRITSGQSSGTQWGETFTIDAWGNLTDRSGETGKTNYEPLTTTATTANQLVGYGYDLSGNMTNNNGTLYVYDAENRLVWTSGYRYLYDGNGERVEKCAAASSTTACPTSGTSGTLYWKGTGSNTLDETDLSENVLEQYVYFNGVRVARRDVATNAVHYYFSDHLGTHTVVENATGTACEQDADYYPYGGEENDYCTTPVDQHYKFNGKERDTESGLDNFGARFDASSLGRFMTPDWAEKPTAVPYAHFGNPQSLNLYSYVENNPTTMGDPDGHAPWSFGGWESQCGDDSKCQPNKQQQWSNAAANAAQSAAQKQQTQTVVFSDSSSTSKENRKPGDAADRNVDYQAGKMDKNGNIVSIDRHAKLTLHEKLDPSSKSKGVSIADPPNSENGVYKDYLFVYSGQSYRTLRDWSVNSSPAKVLDLSTHKAYDYELNTMDSSSTTPIKTEYVNIPPF